MKKAVLVLGCLLAFAAAAQEEAAIATKVEGVVTVGQGGNVGLLQPGAKIVDGTRIVTGSSGSTVVQVSPTCSVPIGPNQAFTFAAGKSCTDLVASVQNVGGTQLATAGPKTGLSAVLGGSTAATVATVALAGVLIREATRSSPISGQ